mmetsp:Transcript_70059/g.167372  ORF Transcript_70059/g.167372 Transcript_70059/m.167372 type:complete len:278 (-) Transcript_70059:470-1303(-)
MAMDSLSVCRFAATKATSFPRAVFSGVKKLIRVISVLRSKASRLENREPRALPRRPEGRALARTEGLARSFRGECELLEAGELPEPGELPGSRRGEWQGSKRLARALALAALRRERLSRATLRRDSRAGPSSGTGGVTRTGGGAPTVMACENRERCVLAAVLMRGKFGKSSSTETRCSFFSSSSPSSMGMGAVLKSSNACKSSCIAFSISCSSSSCFANMRSGLQKPSAGSSIQLAKPTSMGSTIAVALSAQLAWKSLWFKQKLTSDVQRQPAGLAA